MTLPVIVKEREGGAGQLQPWRKERISAERGARVSIGLAGVGVIADKGVLEHVDDVDDGDGDGDGNGNGQEGGRG